MVSKPLRHYADPNDYNSIFYHQRNDDMEAIIQRLLTDSDCLLHLCRTDFEDVTEYRLFTRCLSDQTVVENDKRRLRTREDGTMNSSALQNPSDPDAIENVCKEAQDKGISVMCWDNLMTNSDLNWVIDNVDLGYMVAEEAGKFIEEHYGEEEVEVAVLGYPQTEVLLEREQGILKGLEELEPNARVVENQPAIDTTAALNATETILQANPNLKVVCTVGCVRSLGANEAFKAKGITGEDVGIFGVDATDDLDQLHAGHGIEEVHPDEGTAQTLADLGDGQGGGVGGEDALGLADLVQLAEGGLLHAHVLERGLHDQVAVGAQVLLQAGGDGGHGGVGLSLVHLALFHQLGVALLDLGLAAVGPLLLDVAQGNGPAALGERLGDALAHSTGADNTNFAHDENFLSSM